MMEPMARPRALASPPKSGRGRRLIGRELRLLSPRSFQGLNVMNERTRLSDAIERGDPRVAEELLPLVYEELRRLAARRLAREKPGQTLQATALVNEAYMRLVGGDGGRSWDGRGHFLAAAAEAMRRILIDNARRKQCEKHGGGRRRRELDEVEIPAGTVDADVLALDEALIRFAAEDPAKAELVKLRYFAGLSIDEAASVLGISAATAKRHWAYSRAWLFRAIEGGVPPSPS
jgi:RNA polymerase sigma factor (TIGR02999 family)